MPRAKRKGEQSFEEKQIAIKAGVADVKGGESIRSAAKRFGIPRTTLQEHCSKLQMACTFPGWESVRFSSSIITTTTSID